MHTYVSNAKATIHGIYHGVSLGYLESYLEEYNLRYNQKTESNVKHNMEKLLSLLFKADICTEKQFKYKFQTKNYYFKLKCIKSLTM